MKYSPGMRITPNTVPMTMPPSADAPMVLLPTAPGALGDDQRIQAGDERERGHQDRPEAGLAPAIGRLEHGGALAPALDGELDDQHRVLAEQTDQHDQADLGVDVVRQAHEVSIRNEPNAPAGSDVITASGRTKLSYCAASTR
jgi:hypothetical protein